MGKGERQFAATSESQKQIAGPKINLRRNQIEEQKCLKQRPEGLEGGREGVGNIIIFLKWQEWFPSCGPLTPDGLQGYGKLNSNWAKPYLMVF